MKRSRNFALAVRTSTDIDHCCRQVLRSLNETLSSGVSLKKKPLLAHSRSKRPLPISNQGEAHDRTASSFQTSAISEAAPVEPREKLAARSEFDKSRLSAKSKRINLEEMDKRSSKPSEITKSGTSW